MSLLRRKLRRRAGIVACVLVASAAHGETLPPAPKCVCSERVKPLEALERYDMIFFGLASFVGISEPGDSATEDEFVEFSVEGIWKGLVQRRLRVHTHDGDPLCAYRFTLGKHYLVYARLEKTAFASRYRTSTCARTTEASRALPDLAILGPPQTRLEE